MKKMLLVLFILTLFMAISCKKDDDPVTYVSYRCDASATTRMCSDGTVTQDIYNNQVAPMCTNFGVTSPDLDGSICPTANKTGVCVVNGEEFIDFYDGVDAISCTGAYGDDDLCGAALCSEFTLGAGTYNGNP